MTKTAWIITGLCIAVLAVGTLMILQTEPPVSVDAHGHAHGSEEAGHDDHADEGVEAHADHEGHDHAEGEEHSGHEGHDHAEGEEHSDHDGHDHAEGESHTDDEHQGSDVPKAGDHSLGVVKLSREVLRANGVTFMAAGPGEISHEIQLPGEIALNADRVAHIVPRFSGIAQKVFKKLGDKVESGEVLAIVQSNESVAPYEVKSLLSGAVIERHITLGEYVRDDADVFVVADLSTVWVHISVYPKYLPHIRTGVRVRLQATGGSTTEGTIDYIGPIVGERTRTAQARVVLDNTKGEWQPGLFVTARLAMDKVSVGVAVPDEAIQTVEGQPAVFVLRENGVETRVVTLGLSDGRWVEVLSGLRAGEEIAASNTFLIKAEFGKSEAGHDH